MPYNRRDFILNTAMSALGMTFFNFDKSFANNNSSGIAKNLILVLNRGGWDTTYVFDAKPESSFVDTPQGSFREFENITLFTHTSRPHITTFFERYGQCSTIINGINVPSVSHPGCLVRMLTGTRKRSNPDFATIIGNILGADLPIPYLAFGEASFKGDFASGVGHVGATSQLRSLVDINRTYPPISSDWHRYNPTSEEESLIQNYVKERLRDQKTKRGQYGYNKNIIKDFELSLNRGHQLPQFAEIFGNRGRKLRLEEQAVLSVEALEKGLSRAILIDSGLDWDTHTNNESQGMHFNTMFESLIILAEELENKTSSSGTFLDETLVVVLSEMGRTPILTDGGKNHWPFTSMLLFGAGVRGGSQNGATDDLLVGVPIDYQTGQKSSVGSILNSENVIAGILKLMGIDSQKYLPDVAPLTSFYAV